MIRLLCLTLALAWAALFVVACTSSDPTGPDITVANNTAPVNVTTGSSSPVGTAPCGAASSQKNVTPSGPNADCSVVTLPPEAPAAP